jgi:protein-disulfide isomerase
MPLRPLAAVLLAAPLVASFASCHADPAPVAPPAVVTLPPPSVATAMPLVVVAPSPPPPARDLPGVDTHGLDARERAEWADLVRELMAPCLSVAVPVGQCVEEHRDCRACAPAAEWVAHAVHEGLAPEQIRARYLSRFDPVGVKSLPLGGSPSRGPADAPVTVVEFVDLECPHCREGSRQLDAAFDAHPGKVRIVFKSFALSAHPHAEAAARAAFAAGRQGKFWEMEHLLLEGQEHLEPRDIEGYARSLKLDLARWRADMASPAVAQRVAGDRQLGDDLKLRGTPTFYVDGREVAEDDTLEDRIRQEL